MADALIPEELYELRASVEGTVVSRSEGIDSDPVIGPGAAYTVQIGVGTDPDEVDGTEQWIEHYLPGRADRYWEPVTLVAEIGDEVRKGDLLGIYRSRQWTSPSEPDRETGSGWGCWSLLKLAAYGLAVIAIIVTVIIISIGGGDQPIQKEPPGVIDRGSGAPTSSAPAETYGVGQADNTAPPAPAVPNQCQAPMDGGGFAFRVMTPANALTDTLLLSPTGSIDLRVQLDAIDVAEVLPEDMEVVLDPGGDLAQWARLTWDPATTTATVERGIGVDAFPMGPHLLSILFEHQPANPPPHPYRCAMAFSVEVR